MTKQNLQQEILAKVKPGTKPPHLKKLKRSKSADDIPKAPPTSTPLTRSQSNQPFTDPKYPYTTLISQQQELETLKKESETKSTTISLLRKKIDELEAQLRVNPPNALLTDQLTEKQQQIEDLRKRLEQTNTELNSLKQEKSNLLDTNLTLKHQSLKDWWKQYEKTQELATELKENVDYASDELIKQDKTISQLRGQVIKLQQTNQSLTKDLNLATKLAELRKNPLPNPNSNYSHLLTWAFLALWFISLLNSSWNHNFKDNE